MAYKRFTKEAQAVIMGAQKESENFKHGYIGTEHILLGIMLEDGYAKKTIESFNIDFDEVRDLVEEYLGFGDYTMPKDELLLTPRTKKLFDESFVEASRFNHKYASPEHMLLALIKEDDSVAYTLLSKLNVDFKKIEKDLEKYLENKNEKEDAWEEGVEIREEKGSILTKYSIDLTKQAKKGKLDPVIGRETENRRILEILCRRIKNNPCLIGEPGVGKTAVVEGLAQNIIEGNVPENLKGKRVLSLDLSAMVAGAKYRGEFEDRLKKAISEIKEEKNIIIFIDEIHTIIGAGGAEGAIDAANILKPALARGEIQCIGATTTNEYKKYIEKDTALERRFQPIMVGEPNKEETLEILKGLREKYETHHNVKILDESLKAAVNLSDRYITDRFMPDKAIDLIDEASAKLRIENLVTPSSIKEINTKIEKIMEEKENAVDSENFEKAAELKDKELSLKEEKKNMKRAWLEDRKLNKLIVTPDEIAKVVSGWTKIPVEKLTEKESEKLLNLEKILHKRVVGQEEAISALSKAIRRARVGLRDPKRPIGSFIFLGPTGVGKTELCKALAEAMFSDEKSIIRIDMSEYMEKHSVSRLVGPPPGYVGYEEGGQLSEQVRRRPYSVLLFDEIEKAHGDVFNILLQVLDDGQITDSNGRKVDFKNTVIIMTSNAGAQRIMAPKNLGFITERSAKEDHERMKSQVMEEVKQLFKPEFINRVDGIMVFHTLEKPQQKEIVKLLLKELSDRLSKNPGFVLNFSDKVADYVLEKGYDPQYGARPLRRAIQNELEDFLADEYLEGHIKNNDKILLDIEKDKPVIQKERKKKKTE